MNGIEITTTLTQADWQAYQMAFASRLQGMDGGRRSSWMNAAIVGLVSFALAFVLAYLSNGFGERMPFIALALGAALCYVTLLVLQRRIQRRAAPNAEGAILGRCIITFDATGIRTQKQAARSEHAWALVQDATLTTEHLFLWIDRISALIVPLRDFPPGIEPSQTVDRILEMAAAAGNAVLPPPALIAANDNTTTADRDVVPTATFPDFMRAAFRLFTLRTAERSALLISDRSVVLLAVFGLALLIGTDRVLAGPGSRFYPDGLPATAWYVVASLIVGWVGARLSEPSIGMRRIVIVQVALAPCLVLAFFLFAMWGQPDLQGAALLILALYAIIVLERALRSITLRRQPRSVAAMMLLACGAAWASHHYYFEARFWYPIEGSAYTADEREASEAYLEQWRAAEATLFGQAERIRTAVAALERPSELKQAGFFVGFAGMGEQRVFAGEIELADHVIANKFATNGRALRLVNDRRDLTSYALASPTALRYALKEIAQKMHLEQDVLFLALSSHGSEKAHLSVSNLSLPVNDLTASALADALRDSGIKWRVVIVSACYAGTFIEPLRNDNTIVMTAAAADRTSFGCSDDRDLTYFGEAFYRDSLPGAPTLEIAFERAKASIAAREKLEGLEPSNPQAHFGAAITDHLEHFGSIALSD